MYSIKRLACIVLTALVAFSVTASAAESNAVPAATESPEGKEAARKAAAQKVVDDAVATLQNFEADTAQAWFRENVKKARAVFIVPRLGKGGFIFGGSGGRGLAMVRDEDTGTWSQPAFYTIGSASVGLQIGAQEAEVIYLIMSDAGMNALMDTKFQVGADGTVVGGPVGVGAQAATTDVLSFSRGQGLFGGITAEGTVIHPDFKRNTAYYGETVSASDILLKKSVYNDAATELVMQVATTSATE